MLSQLTFCLPNVAFVFFDGAGQTEQLDQPALVHNQRVDVATSHDLGTRIIYYIHSDKNTFGLFCFT